jgi:hypothetical protein
MVDHNVTFGKQYEQVQETLEKMNWYMENRNIDEKINRFEKKFTDEIQGVSMQNFQAKNDWKTMFKRLSDFDEQQAISYQKTVKVLNDFEQQLTVQKRIINVKLG